MLIKAVKNNINELNPGLQSFGFNQDDDGKLDITLGRNYAVYGIWESKMGTLYLVKTDTIYSNLPGWMPSEAYDLIDNHIPDSWAKKEYKNSNGHIVTITSHPEYFKDSEDIEDATPEGYRIFDIIRKEADEDFEETSKSIIFLDAILNLYPKRVRVEAKRADDYLSQEITAVGGQNCMKYEIKFHANNVTTLVLGHSCVIEIPGNFDDDNLAYCLEILRACVEGGGEEEIKIVGKTISSKITLTLNNKNIDFTYIESGIKSDTELSRYSYEPYPK